METGRNDTCPCGSGKKYKKCCLESDLLEKSRLLLIQNENDWEPEVGSLINGRHNDWDDEDDDGWDDEDDEEWDDEEDDEDDGWDDDDDDEDDDDDDDGWDDEDDEDEDEDDSDSNGNTVDNEDDNAVSIMLSKAPPILSEEENALVDEWHFKYKRLRSTVKKREHLTQFMDTYPHLVFNLKLHWSILFEMGSDHYKKGLYEIFVELLLRIRKEFPDTYMQNYAFYDADLIYWYVAQGRIDEISQFFDFFKQDTKGELYDVLYSVIYFLQTINRSDIVMAELAKNKYTKNCVISERINHFLLPYLDKPASEEAAILLKNELISDGIDEDDSGGEEYLYKRMLRLKRPFTIWDSNLPKTRSLAMSYYFDITDNFSFFLYEKIGLSFDSAEYYADFLYQYYKTIVYNEHRPDNMFCLDNKTFTNHAILSLQSMYDYNIDYLTLLNAFYYYAEYLKTCGNLTEEEKDEFQAFIIETFNAFYATVEKSGPEMLSFKQFPLWGTYT